MFLFFLWNKNEKTIHKCPVYRLAFFFLRFVKIFMICVLRVWRRRFLAPSAAWSYYLVRLLILIEIMGDRRKQWSSGERDAVRKLFTENVRSMLWVDYYIRRGGSLTLVIVKFYSILCNLLILLFLPFVPAWHRIVALTMLSGQYWKLWKRGRGVKKWIDCEHIEAIESAD